MKIEYVGRHASETELRLPLYISRVEAGFPSAADDYIDKKLDLNEYLIKHPAATFYCRVSGNSMQGKGIFDGDLLIVDRAVEPTNGCVVIASLNGEMTCKVLDTKNKRLLAVNKNYPPIPITEDMDVAIEGVVIHSIRTHQNGGGV